MSTKLIAELSKDIAMFKNTPMSVTAKDDPYVSNMSVARQLQKQVHEENALQKSIIIIQQNSAHFEQGIVRAIQSAWQTYDEWQTRASSQTEDVLRGLATHMGSLAPDREWIAFAARSDHLLDPDTPLRNPEHVEYPSKEDPSVIPVHTGNLERKKRFTRSYSESYFVLTAAGYLHQYPSSDPTARITPIFSLFLPACTLGPPSSSTTSRSHKFHIETKKDGTGTLSSKTSTILGRSSSAYTFRARSHEDMMEWWNDIRMLVARYLVASEQMERSGPIAAAVRAAGYLSEDEEEDEEDGSSVEEEADDEVVGGYHSAAEGDESGLPSYSHPNGAAAGTHGYPIDKKEGADLGRRPSKRQQEKAPEGQEPRAHQAGNDDEAAGSSSPGHGAPGPAPTESRFQESL